MWLLSTKSCHNLNKHDVSQREMTRKMRHTMQQGVSRITFEQKYLSLSNYNYSDFPECDESSPASCCHLASIVMKCQSSVVTRQLMFLVWLFIYDFYDTDYDVCSDYGWDEGRRMHTTILKPHLRLFHFLILGSCLISFWFNIKHHQRN